MLKLVARISQFFAVLLIIHDANVHLKTLQRIYYKKIISF